MEMLNSLCLDQDLRKSTLKTLYVGANAIRPHNDITSTFQTTLPKVATHYYSTYPRE